MGQQHARVWRGGGGQWIASCGKVRDAQAEDPRCNGGPDTDTRWQAQERGRYACPYGVARWRGPPPPLNLGRPLARLCGVRPPWHVPAPGKWKHDLYDGAKRGRGGVASRGRGAPAAGASDKWQHDKSPAVKLAALPPGGLTTGTRVKLGNLADTIQAADLQVRRRPFGGRRARCIFAHENDMTHSFARRLLRATAGGLPNFGGARRYLARWRHSNGSK